jgi:hypothetical protein
MDREFVTKASEKRASEGHPTPGCDMGSTLGSARNSSPSDLLMHRAKQLRDEAYKLESLARSLDRCPLDYDAAASLADVIVRGAFR